MESLKVMLATGKEFNEVNKAPNISSVHAGEPDAQFVRCGPEADRQLERYPEVKRERDEARQQQLSYARQLIANNAEAASAYNINRIAEADSHCHYLSNIEDLGTFTFGMAHLNERYQREFPQEAYNGIIDVADQDGGQLDCNSDHVRSRFMELWHQIRDSN
jgi:hypothetical protein